MKRSWAVYVALGVVLSAANGIADTTIQTPPASRVTQAEMAGIWHSREQFEGEPRVTVAINERRQALVGWAVLLGQYRRGDNRATLGVSFTEAVRDGPLIRFDTILPEDEGTITWELRVISPARAVLVAVSEDGQPMEADLQWEMAR